MIFVDTPFLPLIFFRNSSVFALCLAVFSAQPSFYFAICCIQVLLHRVIGAPHGGPLTGSARFDRASGYLNNSSWDVDFFGTACHFPDYLASAFATGDFDRGDKYGLW